MFDFFAPTKPQPKLYICDIVLSVKDKTKYGKAFVSKFVMNRIPMTLLNGNFPSEKYKEKIYKKMFDEFIRKGDYKLSRPKMSVEILNPIYASDLAYTFDYDKD